ncbi:hypothetical protein G195_003160 [Phytophthora kernoviae 00238/432]|uniref:Uncharacterized protein n=1 Tax=Phytophthora kernoviae 00238/432 TaxID=1284355 RepID=A0A8J4SG53_9STRA|nr:hypothetical protein G195_003160 [Phytophthora kernoviae 00238/432]
MLIFMQGFNSGMNALCSQAFGAKNFHLVGEYALLTSLLLTVACVPLAVLWWNLGDILLAAGVTDRVAALAAVYCRLSLLWLWPRSIFQVLSCFYQAQHIVQPTAAFNMLAVALNGFFVVGLNHGRFGLPKLGFVGCPLGTSMALSIRLVGYVVYMNLYRKYHRRCAWRCDGSFLDGSILRNLLSVGLPLAGGTIFENAQLITMTLYAATIGEVQLGTHNAMMELFFFATSPLYAVVTAAVTRMGTHLGAGQPSQALLSAQAVLKAQARPMPIMVGFAVGAWLVGVPTAYILGIHQTHPDLLGIWHGMICGYAVTSAIGFAAAFGRPNWQLEAEKAVARSHIKEKEFASPQESDVLLP